MSTQGLLFQSASNMQILIQRVGLVQSRHHHDILYVAGNRWNTYIWTEPIVKCIMG
jgi:hypothetical protein